MACIQMASTANQVRLCDDGSMACSPLWALSKCRQRQRGTRCSGPESVRWICPYFPPNKWRYVSFNPIKITPEMKYRCSLCRLTLLVRSGPVRSSWLGGQRTARGSVRLREPAGAVWTRREIRAGRSLRHCDRGGSQSEARAGQVGGLFTCAVRMTNGGQRRADRQGAAFQGFLPSSHVAVFIYNREHTATPQWDCWPVGGQHVLAYFLIK